ncbi:AAA family ATPase [Anditalea andensis]|uniref:Rad50/SbcC-type AAA domain-containing protein n=1 Tax=Anditalea andensis TaxID=1048983 RepID=A0A074LI14_9BACT|nr:SMC family ATPase [Anditalea andensis]KEO73437.1 hypothetical protein EL17_13950 [Anditalea andensis]
MIPVTLDIEGLYSYKEKQTIDFNKLTSAGLFGIFGAVGSGKSSILEAILLALYGNTERLSSRGEKSSMLNLQSNRVAITFQFKAGKNNQYQYKAEYVASRNKNNWEDVRPAVHTFYRATNTSSWEPLDQGAEEILGMKMDHFRQTVIIPQGKFKDFIELKPKDRADMMKDLFGLERFELSSQTKNLLSEVNTKKLTLKTQLEGMAEFTEDLLQEQGKQLSALKEKEGIEEKKYTLIEEELSKAKLVRERFLELKELQIQYDELQKHLPQIERSRSNLQQYQTATQHFKPLITQLDELKVDLEKYSVSVTNCKRWKTEYEEKVAELIHTETALQKEFAKKGEREAKIRDLKKVMEINALQLKSRDYKKTIEQLRPSIEGCREKIIHLTEQIEAQEKQMDLLKTPDPNELADLKTYIREIRDNQLVIDQTVKELQSLQGHLTSVTEEIKAIKGQIPEGLHSLENWMTFEENKGNHLLTVREKLIQQQGLSRYAPHLHDGQPCPLCGSDDHPNPIEAEFDTVDLQTNEMAIKDNQTALAGIRRLASTLDKIVFSHSDVVNKIEDKEKQLKEVQSKRQNVFSKINEKGFDSLKAVEDFLNESAAITVKQQQLFQSIKTLRLECGQLTINSKSDEEKLQSIQNEYTAQLSAIASKKEDLQYKVFCEAYFSQTNDVIQDAINKVQQAIDQLEIKIQRNKDVLIESRGKQSTNLANLNQYTELLKGCEDRQLKLKDDLQSKMQEMGFEMEHELKAILDQNLDVAQLENSIREFERQWDITKDKLEALQQNKAVNQFNEAAFEQLNDNLRSAKTILGNIKSQLTLTHNHMETTLLKLEEKAKLNKNLDTVEKRESQLRELDRLFQGSGFVKYVSSIYLKDLSHAANLRFMKLTNNNLSMEIDSDNTFWVLDHLNGGKRRLLKTLSGGQTFQASLCLALALAEKVKSLNRADQSFFFLDEGFGSLDKNSLRVVFETLKSLHQENRIVGIISHVEELQQEIGVYAEVELDGEKGSVVRYSY